MKKLTVLALFSIISWNAVFACGWQGFDRHAPTFLLYEVGDLVPTYDQSWKPGKWRYDYDGVLKEWNGYIKDSLARESLPCILYGPADENNPCYSGGESYEFRVSMAKDRLAVAGQDTVDYVLYVMDRNKKDDPWAERKDISREQFDGIKKIVYGGKVNDFLKRRYAYQAIRYGFWLGSYDEVIKLYEDVFKTDPKRDIPYYRSTDFYGSAFLKKGMKQEALSIYMDLYFQYPLYRYGIEDTVHGNFDVSDLKNFMDTKISVEKKASVAYMAGDLESLVKLEPAADRTKFAVYARIQKLDYDYVNKIWPWFVTGNPLERGFSGGFYKAEITRMEKIILQLLDPVSGRQPRAFWNLMQGYLMLLGGNLKESGDYLNRSKISEDTNEKIKTQADELSLLISFIKNGGKIAPGSRKRSPQNGTCLRSTMK